MIYSFLPTNGQKLICERWAPELEALLFTQQLLIEHLHRLDTHLDMLAYRLYSPVKGSKEKREKR